MLYILLFTILSFSQSSSDTVEVKGTNGIFYRALVNQDTLYFQYKTGLKWSEPIVIDNGDVASPSIAISSGNYLHIAWGKQGGVFYRTTLQPINSNSIKNGLTPQLSAKLRISTHMPQTEPASDLFIKALGDTVFVQWYCPGELDDNKEIWQRKKWISRPYYDWFQPINLSKELNRY